jgi:hypothetical protein
VNTEEIGYKEQVDEARYQSARICLLEVNDFRGLLAHYSKYAQDQRSEGILIFIVKFESAASLFLAVKNQPSFQTENTFWSSNKVIPKINLHSCNKTLKGNKSLKGNE